MNDIIKLGRLFMDSLSAKLGLALVKPQLDILRPTWWQLDAHVTDGVGCIAKLYFGNILSGFIGDRNLAGHCWMST